MANAPAPVLATDVMDAGELLKTLRTVLKGDFTVRLPLDRTGVAGEIAGVVNDIIEMNERMTAEFARVSTAVGKEGQINQRVSLGQSPGSWGSCVDSINTLIADLVQPTTEVGRVIGAVATGDLAQKMALEIEGRPLKGEFMRTARIVNAMVDQLGSFASEVTRVAREVGTEGKLGGQAQVKGVAGTWKDLTDNVNLMAYNLTGQVRNIADVTTAVANGDLSKKITVDVKGEILELKNTINTMVDQLNSFASEVTRVAREVGTEGKLGGQADVKGVAGTWKDLTDNVNLMASNLTSQVRGIAKVVTAVANGDLKRKLTLEAKGEIAELAETINGMTDTLATFAEQVTSVAREVGVEGKLGGQARVPGAFGTWRDLTDNVNGLAANLTTQVRAIAEVATAVTKGDLTRSITVGAQGEVAALKDNINEMIRNLEDTTRKNADQDWLKTNLAKFTRMLQGQKSLEAVSQLILSELAPLVSAQHGLFYIAEAGDADETMLKLLSSYAYTPRSGLPTTYKLGESIVGQCAFEKQRILMTHVPTDYIQISSGLGAAAPLNLIVLPVLFEGEVKAVIELASFSRFSKTHQVFLDQLTESIGIVLNTIAANMRTETLLKQSQSLTEELQSQQQELRETNDRLERQAASLRQSEELLKRQQEALQQTNEELEEKATLLAFKNTEVEQAKQDIEEKAEQLAITSKYKSEFLANMSHELRTPLNSLLILAKLLMENSDGNLTGKQVEFSRTIHTAGGDLLTLINDILDLSKIESGTMTVDLGDVAIVDLLDHCDRSFRQVAQHRGLEFTVDMSDKLPRAIETDGKRLQQVVTNLLSNAFKFTEQGQVAMRVAVATGGWSPDYESLNRAETVIAFSVTDTGIGIPLDKQKLIFEAFQQADGSTSRKYGGTGLGLSISREIARLLGGELRVSSAPGEGSVFTFYLPARYVGPTKSRDTGTAMAPPAAVAALTGDFLEVAKPAVPAGRPDPDMAPTERREIGDDMGQIQPGDKVLLIIEDDLTFARAMLAVARNSGFKGLIALDGEHGLRMLQKVRVDAVTLDIRMPGIMGWAILDRLKHDPSTRHIPVHIVSGSDDGARARRQGAFGFLQKPVSNEALTQAFGDLIAFLGRQSKQLLIVEDDPVARDSMVALISDEDLDITAVGNGEAALVALQEGHFDCMVIDLGLPDMTGLELIERVHDLPRLRHLPIIVHTGRELTTREEIELKRLAETVIIKDARSAERLLDETTLYLHRAEADLPEAKRRMLQQVQAHDPALSGRTVLIVDDDVRNLYALTSVLEKHGLKVMHAENGREGIETVKRSVTIDAVLMDVMMPEVDGYEATRTIRQTERGRELPIIALTAKAMKGDREKCLDAGASDYITKPVDVEQLLSLLRVWLYR